MEEPPDGVRPGEVQPYSRAEQDRAELHRVHDLVVERACPHGHTVVFHPRMECTGPDAITAMLNAAVRAGAVCAGAVAHRAGSGLPRPQPFDDEPEATIELLDADGELVDDRCVPRRPPRRSRPGEEHLDPVGGPTGRAWGWWCRAVELRPVRSDCPTCSPDAATLPPIR